MAKKKIQVEAGALADQRSALKVEEANAENLKGEVLGVPELTEEQKQYARMTVRKEFNENFSKWAHMEDDDADDAYIELTKADFQKVIDETKAKLFPLSDEERGLATAKLLKELNANKFTWSNGQWKGVLKFDQVVSGYIETLEKEPKALEVDYSTLMYLYAAMTEPKGTGLEEAKKMSQYENYDYVNDKPINEDAPVTYSGINEYILRNINWLSSNDKKLNILKERVNFAYAGIKMTLKATELEEFLEFYDAINAKAIENDPNVKQQLGE